MGLETKGSKKGLTHEQKSIVAGAETVAFVVGSLVFPPLIIGAGITLAETLRQQDLDVNIKENEIDETMDRIEQKLKSL